MTPAPRIEVLSAALADQIAAGEVVERPASVVKELVENALDAGAKRIEIELEGGGSRAIRVVDDGAGIHADDLELAIRRHATSKIRRSSDLNDIRSLGFRGEALASIAAVATLDLRSRRHESDVGTELLSRPGRPPDINPVGMAVGTQVHVANLFAGIPARRKFLRSEAAEVAQCSEAVLRIALVHPDVHFVLRHGRRVLIDLAGGALQTRVEQVLGRKGSGPYHEIAGERDGVDVRAWLASPASAGRSRNGMFVVVRRRVVRERNVVRIVGQVMDPFLGDGQFPAACVILEPPAESVDVNVHPQKAEVRFREPQAVYAAVRQVLASGIQTAPWAAGAVETGQPSVPASGPSSAALEQGGHARGPAKGYRLQTRALEVDYERHKQQLRTAAADLQPPRKRAEPVSREDVGRRSDTEELQLLTCLPGPIGVFRIGDDLVTVDLRALRHHLLYQRLLRNLGGGTIAAQGLLSPVVVERASEEVDLLAGAREQLSRLGIELEAFGNDAVLVRAVPAQLQACVEQADISDLIDRLLPWLRLQRQDHDETPWDSAMRAIAETRGEDPAPRLARRWVRELIEQGTVLEDVPGIRRLTSEDLVAPA